MTKRDPNQRKYRVLALLILIAFEIVFGAYTYLTTKEVVSQAYIVKDGSLYILLWKGPNNDTNSRHYSYLHQALQFANDELDLQLGPNPNSRTTVASVWSRDDLGKRMIYWTTEEYRFPNRLSFNRHYEAEVYNAAFKRGAYTTSPFGHSLSLVPKLSTH